MTKVELQQANSRLATENATLRAENSRLRASLEARRAANINPRTAAMEAARQMAVRTGKCVAVKF